MTVTVPSYSPVIDWLKCVGMTLILLGHLAGAYTNHLAPPIYPKQLGVAFFVFAMGYSLSVETRPRCEVVSNRLFDMFLWGILTAVVVSILSLTMLGRSALSNFLPFLFGVNVVLNHFPANPTTWYIGTYIHLLILWCIARDTRISAWVFVLVLMFEIGCRALLIANGDLFVAYMLFPNWLGVLTAGVWVGQAHWSPKLSVPALTGILLAAAMSGVGWYYGCWPLIGARTFPFMILDLTTTQLPRSVATSCAVSLLYLSWTLIASLVFWDVPTPPWARFLARNTLLIFIAHMPLFYLVDPLLSGSGWSYGYRSMIELVLCFPGLAAASEFLRRAFPTRRWRDSLRARLCMRELLRTDHLSA
jgi:hypothetical protein